MIFKIAKIKDICKNITSGGTPLTKVSEYYNGDIPWLKTKEVNFNRIYDTDIKITELGLKNSSAKIIPENSVIIAMYGNGDTAGRCAINKIPLCTNQACCNLIVNESKVNYKYLYYNIKSRYEELVSLKNGGAQQNLSVQKIKEIEIKLPTLDYQNKIAEALSVYDNLIENNLKRVKLLEESAELLYKEWFVNFRYPGYEKDDLVDDVPKGWEKVNLYDIAEIKMGYAFKANDFNEDEIGTPAIRIRDIPNQTTKTYTIEEVNSDYIVNKGDILIGMDGNFYNDVWGGQEGYLVQRVCRIRAKYEEYQGFLWQAIKQPINYYEKTITGATVAHLGAKHLKEIEILVPNKSYKLNIDIFNSLYKQKINLLQQNVKLKESRDILIPKLITGEIEV